MERACHGRAGFGRMEVGKGDLSGLRAHCSRRAVCLAACLVLALAPGPLRPAALAGSAGPDARAATPPERAEACPLTTPRYSAQLKTSRVEGRVGEAVMLELALTPPDVPMGFFVTSLADVLQAPAGATGERRPRLLTGFPRIRFVAFVPGDYRLAIRVNLVAKSSCGGVKAATLLEQEALVRIRP